MPDYYKYPKLRRPLEVRLEQIRGQEVLVLRCPLGIMPAPLVLVAAAAPVIDNFDGRTSVEEIAEKLAHVSVSRELIVKLVGILDENFLLESARFHAEEKRFRADFLESGLRKTALAGVSYPADAAKLRGQIEQWLKDSGVSRLPRNPRALIAPHIDYRRGHQSYARTYGVLSESPETLCIVLGTSHQYSRNIFHLSRKHYACPLGDFSTDIDFVDKIARCYGEKRSFADEILHRYEHTIEFQLPFLRLTLNPSKIVPILVGSCAAMYRLDARMEESSSYEEFMLAFTEAVRQREREGRETMIVAGVDMAHLGRAFGDSGSLDAEIMKIVEEMDREYLEKVADGAPAALARYVCADADKRRICGYPALYVLLDFMKRLGWSTEFKLLDYSQSVDYQHDCAVTYAGACFLVK